MLQKQSYLHYQTPTGRSLGFSAAFGPLYSDPQCQQPLQNDRGDMMCTFNLTFCRREDKFFNKKIAREMLNTRETQVVRVRDLPTLLANAERKCQGYRRKKNPDMFNFVLKKFV